MTDLDRLLEKSQRRDPRAFEALVRSQVERLHAVAWQVTRDAHLAEDAVQEAFLRILGGSAPYRRRGRAEAWLTRTTVHAALDLLRSGQARSRREEKYAMRNPSPSAEKDPLVTAEERDAVARGLARLPPLTRACLWLRFAEGKTLRQVAAAVGKGRSATAERVRHGLEALRREMRALGLGTGSAVALGALIEGSPRPATRDDLVQRVLDAAEKASAASGTFARGASPATAGAGIPRTAMAGVAAALLAAGIGTAALLSSRGEKENPTPPPTVAMAEAGSSPERPGEPREETPVAIEEQAPVKAPSPEPAAKADAEAPGVLRVRAVDEDGAPVRDAYVRVRQYVLSYEDYFQKGRPSFTWGGPERTFYRSTGASGEVDWELAPGKYFLSAGRDDLAGDSDDFDVAAGQEIEITLTLPPAPHYIEGHAYLFDRANPLRHASLNLVGFLRPRPEPIVETDGEGRFILGPFHGGDHFVHLGYRDYRLVLIPIVLDAESPQKVEVVFQKGITVSGRVTNPFGESVPGVDVTWQREHTPENARLRTTTDENGAYELRGLERARYFVRVEGLGCGTRPPIEVTLSGAPLEDVPLLAECMPSFEVAVEDAQGEPVSGVWIRLHYRIQKPGCNASGRRSLFTDESGRASLVCVPVQTRIELQVADPRFGYASATIDAPDKKGPVALRLARVPVLAGHVVDLEGQPVSGARVRVKLLTDRPSWAELTASSEEDGTFRFDLLPGTYRVEATARDIGAALIEELEFGPEKVPGLLLTLGTAPAFRVRVLAPDGEPVERGSVTAVPEKRQRGASWVFSALSRRTGPDGWCIFTAEERAYTIRATHHGNLSARVKGVHPGGPPLVLRLVRAAYPASGVVLHEGRPVPRARVGYWRAGSFARYGGYGGGERTDEDGAFRFAAVEGTKDRVYFHAWAPDFAFAVSEPYELPLQGPLENVVVRSLPGRDLEARITDPSGQPVPGARVELEGEGEPRVGTSVTSDAEGRVRIPRLPGSRYRVKAESADQKMVLYTTLHWAGEEKAKEGDGEEEVTTWVVEPDA